MCDSKKMAKNATTDWETQQQAPDAGVSGRRVSLLGYGACFVAGCLWGTGFYFGRLALNEMSVEHMVLYRFLFACLGMLPVALMNLRRFRLTPERCACC